jgi:glycosyltransferase involved in cell wall biosynthesis
MVTNPATLLLFMNWLKRRRGFELNVLVHDIFPENTKPAGISLPFYGRLKAMFDKAYSNADQLIVLGRDMEIVMKDKVSKYNPSVRILLVENWSDIKEVVPKPFPLGRIIVEYAGNIGRVQDLGKVIETLPETVDLHIYGTGAMENKIRRLKRKNVFFHEPFSRVCQNAVLASCHISVVTLRDGMYGLGVPSKVYNILASGRPILYFGPQGSEIDLLIREEKIGFCGWPTEWDMNELEKMGKRARILAENRFPKDLILDKILKII